MCEIIDLVCPDCFGKKALSIFIPCKEWNEGNYGKCTYSHYHDFIEKNETGLDCLKRIMQEQGIPFGHECKEPSPPPQWPRLEGTEGTR